MQVLLVKDGRPKPHDLQTLSDADRAELFTSMVAYAGTYSFDGKTVTHHIEVSWNENWTATDQQRDVQIDGNRVILTTHLRRRRALPRQESRTEKVASTAGRLALFPPSGAPRTRS